MAYRNLSLIAALAMSLGSLAGCGDDGTSETGNSESGETTSQTGSTTAPSTETDPTTGATSAMTSDSTAGSEEGTATTAMTSDTTAGTEEGTATTMTSDTTAGGACVGLDEAECNADAGCMPINGAPIEMTGNGGCLQPLEFIECQVAIGCGDAITYACEGDDAPPFEFLDTCIPDGWFECPAPGGPLPPC